MCKKPSLPKKSPNPLYKYDSRFFKRFTHIAGVDEAGRGPLAGPVVAAACMIEREVSFCGINDSKLLSEKERERFFTLLTNHSQVRFGIGIVDHQIIDEINIYQASLLAMRKALDQLLVLPDFLLVDGVRLVYGEVPAEKIIRGDSTSQMVAAASIIAKVSRDEMMRDFHKQYPLYGFDEHKGYPTPRHLETLTKYGPSPIHRRTFEPVRESLLQHSKGDCCSITLEK